MTGKALVVPLSKQVVEVLKQHRKTMQCLGLNTKDGLVFVTPRTHGYLYDSGFEKVWLLQGGNGRLFLKHFPRR